MLSSKFKMGVRDIHDPDLLEVRVFLDQPKNKITKINSDSLINVVSYK